MKDPTYDRKEINSNPVWKLAFELSEKLNDNAPLGWSQYIPRAMKEFKIKSEPIPAKDPHQGRDK